MKNLPPHVAAILLICAASPTFGGYRDLKQELEAYTPPPILQPPAPPPSAPVEAADAFAVAQQAVEQARERWAGLVDGNESTDIVIPAAVADKAGNDTQSLALLKNRFSLEAIQALIWLRNPAIQAATARFQAALEGFDQVTQLDEILRQYSAFTESVMAGVGPMRGGDTIEMKFPYPGVSALKGQVAEKNVAIAAADLSLVKRDVLAQGGTAYWNLLYTHRALGITRDTLDRLTHLESVATTRYGAGKTSYQDVVKIRIGREKLEEQLETLAQQRVNLETELLTLVDLPPNPDLGQPATTVPKTSLPKLDRLYALALDHRQELSRMRAMVARMERMLEMAETMIQPGLAQPYSLYADQAVLQAGSAAMQPNFGTTVSPDRGSGVPKNAWFGTQDAYLNETRRKLEALRADLADATARTRLMVRKGWFDLDRARRERALYQNRLLELSRTSLDVSTREYASGSVSFADVIASYTSWLDVNLAGERQNSEVGIARIELERRIGTRMPLSEETASGSGRVAR